MKFIVLFILISIFATVELKEQVSKKVQSGIKIQAVRAQSTFNKKAIPQSSMKKKSNFVEVSQASLKQLCLQNEACESCAIEWECSYGVSSEEQQKQELDCINYCIEQTKDADLHEKILQAEGTKRKEDKK